MSDQKEEERRMATLERMLVAASNGPKIEVSTPQIREVGLITVLREAIKSRTAGPSTPPRPR